MKYIIVDKTISDIYTKEFNSKFEAVKTAIKDFAYLTKSDLKKRVSFYVLESSDPDEQSEIHFDGNIILRLF